MDLRDVESSPTAADFRGQQAQSYDMVFKDLIVDVGEKRILKTVSGFAEPGSMLALMGPSGAGKTTLLNVLAGRSVPLTSGSISLNGQLLSKQLKRKISYVLQEDLLLTHLTVRETLTYAAQLRLPDSMPMTEKLAKVEEVVDALDMRNCVGTVIGEPMANGISGGEKKRTSIACELLTNPALLMLDEPTSGLDSSTAYTLVKILKQYVLESRKTVIASIHQPSSQTLFLFDSVLLLCDGEVAYFGDCKRVMEFFANLGLYNQPNYNPADFMLENVSKSSSKLLVMNAVARGQSNFSTKKLRPTKDNGQMTGADDDRNYNSTLDMTSSAGSTQALHSFYGGDVEIEEKESKWPTSFWTQFTVLTKRNFKESLPRILSWSNGSQMLTVSVFYGLLAFQLDSTEETVADRLGLLFFFVVFWAFRCAIEGTISFWTDHSILNKERASGYYRLSAFYLAKMTSELPLTLLLPTIFIAIIYWMTGLSGYIGFLGCWAILLLSCFTAQSVGHLIGAAFTDLSIATTATTLVVLCSMIAGGFYARNLPAWIEWIKYLSYIYYAFSAMIRVEFQQIELRCLPENTTAYCGRIYDAVNNDSTDSISFDMTTTNPIMFPGSLVVKSLQLDLQEWAYTLVLMVLSAVCRLLTYFVLRFIRTPK